MALNHSAISLTYVDYDLESTTITVYGAPVLNDGSNWVAVLTAARAVEAAIDDLVIGTKVRSTFIGQSEKFETVRPDKQAQRETKLFIAGHNYQTFESRDHSIGTLDLAQLATPPAGQNLPSYIDLTVGNGLALKTALDAYWTDKPAYTVQVVTDQAYHVGRNT